jgi:phage-related minor tail protein
VDAAAMTLLLLLLVLPRAVAVVLAVARDVAAAAAAAVASWGPKFLRLATMRRSYFLMASAPWMPSKTVCP